MMNMMMIINVEYDDDQLMINMKMTPLFGEMRVSVQSGGVKNIKVEK